MGSRVESSGYLAQNVAVSIFLGLASLGAVGAVAGAVDIVFFEPNKISQAKPENAPALEAQRDRVIGLTIMSGLETLVFAGAGAALTLTYPRR